MSHQQKTGAGDRVFSPFARVGSLIGFFRFSSR
jgi:hypothetical protein